MLRIMGSAYRSSADRTAPDVYKRQQYFGSTAAPSILSFYPALGVKRDVRSQPELSNYALRGLLSVRYRCV